MTSSNGMGRDVMPSLLLFAMSAKLWLDYVCSNNHERLSDNVYLHRRREERTNVSDSNNIEQIHHVESNGDHQPVDFPLESAEERRGRRNLRLSIDSPTFSEHHFHDGDAPNPQKSPSRARRKNKPELNSVDETSVDERAFGNSVMFLNSECPRWRELMERVSIADSVLTRDASMDFKTKNSNWSHFEGYHDPIAIGLDDNDDQEDFPWSDPPQKYYSDLSASLHTQSLNKDNAQSQTHAVIHQRSSSLEIVRKFNASIMPNKLIMIRHGQSEGNVDEILYSTKPDNAMRLTKLGWDTAKMAGKALRDQLAEGETVHFVVSPYVRTVETFHGIVSAWCDPVEFADVENRNRRLKAWYSRLMEMGLSWHEDPRIREQDFGNYQDPETIRKCKNERHKFGSFYYRFPHGESASDVFDRVSTFLDSLWRSFETQKAQNYVLVTHGISIRVFLARYFRYSIDQFNMLANPKNCEMVILKHDGSGRLQLDSRCEMVFERDSSDDGSGKDINAINKDSAEGICYNEKKRPNIRVVGYEKHRRLKLLPPHLIQPRTAHMFYSDTGL
ncbi:hypothetical protein HJC23_006584 [Cyclotella cryptica]|uniref:Phosphoglycerate mutase n=1 Tax=Cyclotella cryptica TaxID=29204 RepID=A0ABD3PF06_9STRA|eukprot:CCRYP_015324-RC/>CCRYP_015324-RC protein AED:0.07 eAED:0.07 QI:728/1/1/1/0.8/0.66/6/953/558